MSKPDPNIAQITSVARALGSLANDLVFVGGCATGLLITDAARAPIRATVDVDLVAGTLTVPAYYELQENLKGVGFVESQTEVSCRWKLGSLVVDIMPSDATLLGFSNRWYPEVVSCAVPYELPDGTTIRLVTAPLLLATKLEAFHGRGNGDYASHDIEDAITVIDGRPELLDEISASSEELRAYLREEFEQLLGQREFVESIRWHLLPDAASQARAPNVIQTIRKIAGL